MSLKEARATLDEACTGSTQIYPQDLAIVLGHILNALDAHMGKPIERKGDVEAHSPTWVGNRGIRLTSLGATDKFDTVQKCRTTIERFNGVARPVRYFGGVVRAAPEQESVDIDSIHRFFSLLDSMVDAGLIVGKLCDPVSMPLIKIGDEPPRFMLIAYIFVTETPGEMNKRFGMDLFFNEGEIGPEIEDGKWPRLGPPKPKPKSRAVLTDAILRERLYLLPKQAFLAKRALQIVGKIRAGVHALVPAKELHAWLTVLESGRTTEQLVEAVKLVNAGKVVRMAGLDYAHTNKLNDRLVVMCKAAEVVIPPLSIQSPTHPLIVIHDHSCSERTQ